MFVIDRLLIITVGRQFQWCVIYFICLLMVISFSRFPSFTNLDGCDGTFDLQPKDSRF